MGDSFSALPFLSFVPGNRGLMGTVHIDTMPYAYGETIPASLPPLPGLGTFTTLK